MLSGLKKMRQIISCLLSRCCVVAFGTCVPFIAVQIRRTPSRRKPTCWRGGVSFTPHSSPSLPPTTPTGTWSTQQNAKACRSCRRLQTAVCLTQRHRGLALFYKVFSSWQYREGNQRGKTNTPETRKPALGGLLVASRTSRMS